MSSDDQYTALGPAPIGFQTHGANIRIGADLAGNTIGVRGTGVDGPGIIGISDTAGVVGSAGGTGSFREATGVLGEGYRNASGVTGLSLRGDGKRLGSGPGVLGA